MVTAKTTHSSVRQRRNLQFSTTVALFLAPTLLGLAIFQYWPLIAAFRNSLFNINLLNPDMETFVGLQNYIKMWGDADFWVSILRTFTFAIAKIGIQIPLALLLATLVQRKIRGIGIVRSAIFAPLVTSVTVVAVIWNLMYHPDHGIFNAVLQTLGLPRQPFLTSPSQALPAIIFMSIWQDVGFTMLIFLAGLQGIPETFYEAATIDGAGRWGSFRYITLPLLSRTMLFAMVMTTISSFQTFTSVYVMTKGGPLDSTLVAVYYIYEQGFHYLNLGYASALAVVLLLIVMVIAIIQARLMRTDFQY